MKYVLSLLFLLLTLPAFAEIQVPSQKITGNEQPIPLGELVALTVSKPDSTPDGLVGISYTWVVYDGFLKKKTFGDKEEVVFAAGITPKKVHAQCAVTYLYVFKDGDKVKQVVTKTVILSATVIVGEPAPPPPPPGPNPTPPTPSPSFPDGKYKLSQFTFDLANKVQSGNRKVEANALANSFSGIASSIKAGAIKDMEKALRACTASNLSTLAVLKVDRQTWLSPFFTPLQDKLYDLYSSGLISNVNDLALAFGEVADGLRGIQ